MALKNKRIRVEKAEGPRGFSRWITPVMERYMMACCDCGLVHEVQFTALEVTRRADARGRFVAKTLPRNDYRVQMRVRRAERYTAVERKRMGIIIRKGD